MYRLWHFPVPLASIYIWIGGTTYGLSLAVTQNQDVVQVL